ncbi:sigma-54-dependent Fis family transcriptional regulator [Arthrobacter sp. 2RAF6]|uniref:sigma-54-dependent Fis family transcriptional regulator n=1 Tax=Arthrobacter sp. 2RAF6 TaxID=3233002 RepID=UPI003F92C84C
MADPQLDEQLLKCAEPVMSDLERMCLDTNGCVSLTDPLGTMSVVRGEPSVLRWADRLFTLGSRVSEDLSGTNSDGTALEEGTSVQVWGSEHFAENLQDICCTSVPIRDPLRGSIRAVLSLTLPAPIANESDPRSILLIVQGAAAEVSRRLAARLAAREQALLSAYLREVRKRGSDAVVAMDGRTTIASRAAMGMLAQSDYAVLAGYARTSQDLRQPLEHNVTVVSGRVLQLQIRQVDTGDDPVGTVMRLRPAPVPQPSATRVGVSERLDGFEQLVGEGLAFRRALEAAATACSRMMPAYIVGEPGTGKRFLAEAVASRLARTSVVLDCGSGSPHDRFDYGRLMEALDNESAVVVHHIDALAADDRDRLATTLADLEQPRVVLTSRKLTDMMLPLIAALRGIEIQMPALRQRRDDIPMLVRSFLSASANGPRRASPRLIEALAVGDWPGNIRQLRDVLESASAHAVQGIIGPEDLTEAHKGLLARSRLTRLEEVELQQIREALTEADGNRVRAAVILEISRSTLYRKMDTYARRGFELGLQADD